MSTKGQNEGSLCGCIGRLVKKSSSAPVNQSFYANLKHLQSGWNLKLGCKTFQAWLTPPKSKLYLAPGNVVQWKISEAIYTGNII